MQSRPYLRHTIAELQQVFRQAQDDPNIMSLLQDELRYRRVPTAKALRRQVEARVSAGGMASIPLRAQLPELACPPEISRSGADATPFLATPPWEAARPVPPVNQGPRRVPVDCGYCGQLNFIFAEEGIQQHLSCSKCLLAYTATTKHGLVRVTYPPLKHAPNPTFFRTIWVLATILCAGALALWIFSQR